MCHWKDTEGKKKDSRIPALKKALHSLGLPWEVIRGENFRMLSFKGGGGGGAEELKLNIPHNILIIQLSI